MTVPFCYLAHPIDFGRIEDVAQTARVGMMERGWVVFDPLAAFSVRSEVEPDRRIRSVNNMAMSRSDGMLAVLSTDAVTIGVPMEIERMRSGWGKPVAVVGHGIGRSWSLADMPGVQIFDLAHWGIHAALDWLAAQVRERDGWKMADPLLFQVDTEAGGVLPTRAYEGDAGFDLYVSKECVIGPGEFVDVPHAVCVQPPEHIWTRIVGRSSTLRRRGLLVAEGTIDQGYRGELYTGVRNLGESSITVKVGERISQLIPVALSSRVLRPVAVRDLDDSPRGSAGFGSSGA